MKAGWKRVKLGDVGNYVAERCSSSEATLETYISTENLLPNRGGKCLPSSLPTGNVTAYSKNDVLVSNIRPYFKKIWRATDKGQCSNDVLAFRASSNISSHWVYYQLSSDAFFEYCMAGAKGCKMPRGDKAQILKYEILLPPLPVQKRIASVLGALDDKIELNRKMNKNLEEQAQALFKSWFVDFEPWGGKMPKEWKKYQLGEFFPVKTGKKDANCSTIDGEYPFFSCAQETLRANCFSFDCSAILVAGNGEFNVKCYTGKFEAYQRTYVLIPYESRLTSWLFYVVKHNLLRITQSAQGSVIKFIKKGHLEGFEFVAPIDLVKCEMIDKFQSIRDCIAAKERESCVLAEMRDALLPKLMSGEVEV